MWMDYHLHSAHSADCDAPLLDMARAARAAGLNEICFTEHYDIDPYDIGYAYYDDQQFEASLRQARQDTGLTIRKGLEFDYQTRYAEGLNRRLAAYRTDFRIGSVHCVFARMVRASVLERGFPIAAVYAEYFSEIQALIRTQLPSVLGHLDYVGKTCFDLFDSPPADYMQQMTDICRLLVRHNVGLEVNSRYQNLGQPIVPPLAVLSTYRQMGGRIVTLGSDAHTPAALGAGLHDACRTLHQAGFTHYCSFQNMSPTFHPLPQP